VKELNKLRPFHIVLILPGIMAFLVLASSHVHAKVEPEVKGIASILPGLGQALNGDYYETPLWLAATLPLMFSQSPYLQSIGSDLWLYNMYDAYKDAKPASMRYADNNLYSNYIATYNPMNVIDPIGGPFLGVYGVLPGWVRYHGKNVTPKQIFYASFVGLGEEGFFRGFLYPAFTDLVNSKLFGAVVSSALFGLAHTQYNTGGKAVVAAVGLIFCWQYTNNDYDLRKNVFTHSWIDVFLIPPGAAGGADLPQNKTRPVSLKDVGVAFRTTF
jgi:hypothetical protein